MISIKSKILKVLNRMITLLDKIYFEKYSWNCIDVVVFKLQNIYEYIEQH